MSTGPYADVHRVTLPPGTGGSGAFPTRYHVGLIAVLGAVFLIALAPRLDTDLWWHLLDGRYIVTRGAVPTRDYLSFTFAGHRWIDHEWLADTFLYACYRVAGLWGTIAVFAAIICATFALVYRRMAATGTNRMLCLFVLAAAFVASSATWGARPQMLTLLLLSAFCLLIDRWGATRRRRVLLAFPLLTLLWTNLHGGWVLGLALMVLTLLGELCNRVVGNEDAWSEDDLKWFGAAILASVLAAAVNPDGLHEVLYPVVWILPTPWSNVLTEWVSTDFHQPVAMVFEALLLLLVAVIFVGRPPRNWAQLFVILGFTYLALSQSRNVAVWTVVVSPLVALYAGDALHPLAPPREAARNSHRIQPSTERKLNVALIAALLLVYVVETLHFVNPGALRANEAAQYPAGAVRYMDQHRLPSRTFAAYAWGGYLLWKLYPRYRDFIDGRANTLFDDRILHAYLTASTAAPGWQDILQRYRVGTVLIEPDLPLAQVLHQSSDWRETYRDGTAVIYVRTAGR